MKKSHSNLINLITRRVDNIIYGEYILPYQFTMFTNNPDEINAWIIANLKNLWYSWSMNEQFYVSFISEDDATLFKLFWNPDTRVRT